MKRKTVKQKRKLKVSFVPPPKRQPSGWMGNLNKKIISFCHEKSNWTTIIVNFGFLTTTAKVRLKMEPKFEVSVSNFGSPHRFYVAICLYR